MIEDVIPRNLRRQIDGTVESLPAFERWLSEAVYGSSDLFADAHQYAATNCSRYVGEIYREALGRLWTWSISFAKGAGELRGLPVLARKDKKTLPVCPLLLVLEAADKRSGTVFTGTLKKLWEADAALAEREE